mmetsp:Transcript_56756/g.109612  ORF Transcript_56756/g.109612 Transcript_56756/m.109612 type:complete len:112 (+) Transcript_56756:408-743(+)
MCANLVAPNASSIIPMMAKIGSKAHNRRNGSRKLYDPKDNAASATVAATLTTNIAIAHHAVAKTDASATTATYVACPNTGANRGMKVTTIPTRTMIVTTTSAQDLARARLL